MKIVPTIISDTTGPFSATGIEDKGLFKDAVHLNNFDDWTEFRAGLK